MFRSVLKVTHNKKQRTNENTNEIIKNKNKMETMYQVHIKEGINAEVRNYDSLDRANRYVLEKASEMGLQYGIDQDGWAFAHTGDDYSPARTEIFIFQII